MMSKKLLPHQINNSNDMNLVATSSMGFSSIYYDVINNGLQTNLPSLLINSHLYDSVLCSHVADLDGV